MVRVGWQGASLKQQVLVRLLGQHVGRLGDRTESGQAGGDLELRLLPQLLLLLLNFLQPGGAENQFEQKTSSRAQFLTLSA